MEKAPPKIALSTSVLNEAEALEIHIRYHALLGISRYYVYLDQCTDKSLEVASSHPLVKIIPPDPDLLLPRPQFAIRQMMVMKKSLQLAREEGMDWLLFIDVDEFAFGDNAVNAPGNVLTDEQRLYQQASLVRLVQGIPKTIQQVVLRPKEVVAFTSRKETKPSLHEFCYFIHLQSKLQRNVRHPRTGKRHKVRGLLGHKFGKSLIRVSGNYAPITPHQWGLAQADSEPRDFSSESQQLQGSLFHYLFTSRDDWRRKYGKHSSYHATRIKGRPVEYFKQASKELAVSCSDVEADAWLKEIIIQSRLTLLKWRLLGWIHKDNSVASLLRLAAHHRDSEVKGCNNSSDSGNRI